MNRVEAAASRMVPDNNGQLKVLGLTAVETPTGQPIAGTPAVFFAAFGVAYLVAKAFGPYQELSEVPFGDLVAEGITAEDLVALRQAGMASA